MMQQHRNPALSGSGALVAFDTTSSGMGGDIDLGDGRQIVLRNRTAGTTELISKQANGQYGWGMSQKPWISDNGRYVAYETTATNLYVADVNGQVSDVLRHDRTTGVTTAASRIWNSISTGNDFSNTGTVSDDGNVVAFRSAATNLVAYDANGATDAYIREFSLDYAPFNSLTALAHQIAQDVGGQPATASEIKLVNDYLRQGLYTPDSLVALVATAPTGWAKNYAPVVRLYWSFFLRPPDKAGMEYWVGQYVGGSSLPAIAAKFAQSNEFKTTYGSLSNSAFVTLVYQNVFERHPDAGGLAFWTAQLDQKKKTRGDVMTNFSESSEGKRYLAPRIDSVVVFYFMLRQVPGKPQLDTLAGIVRTYSIADVARLVRLSPEYAARITP